MMVFKSFIKVTLLKSKFLYFMMWMVLACLYPCLLKECAVSVYRSGRWALFLLFPPFPMSSYFPLIWVILLLIAIQLFAAMLYSFSGDSICMKVD